jgi:hypothetical protein
VTKAKPIAKAASMSQGDIAKPHTRPTSIVVNAAIAPSTIQAPGIS